VTLWLCAGCSFVAVSGPPADHAQRVYFDCTTSKLAPLIDLAAAGLFAASALVPVTNDSGYDSQERLSTAAVSLGLTTLELVAGVQGWRATDECRHAKRELAQRLEEQRVRAARPVGCRVDIECKGERICMEGRCVDPPAGATQPSAAEPLAPSVTPELTAPP
jgi:hypothetical protein